MSQLISVYIVDDMGFNVNHVKKEILALEFKVSGTATDPNVAMKEILDSESRPDILITDIICLR
ncbi:hypothetical protein HMPREF3127_04510 [Sphingobacterium sp. HMSC13C05]|nr:hypothetical protein HMPREF3127_04510 [Sphingobacterium sp. HMSC13C05]